MTELDGYKTEWLVTGGDQSEVSSTEQVRRKSSELGHGEDAIRIQFHHTGDKDPYTQWTHAEHIGSADNECPQFTHWT